MATNWHLTTIIYQIDPSLFLDSDGDGCGDLGGIIEKLDYLQALGVGTLWLTPIYEACWRDAGYDVTDHRALDRRFGRETQLLELVHEAKRRGMRIILELVMQHVCDQHPWFVAARNDRSSPYRDYLIGPTRLLTMAISRSFLPSKTASGSGMIRQVSIIVIFSTVTSQT